MVDSSSDLGLLIQQVSYEDQTLGVEVDVLLWTWWLLYPNSPTTDLRTQDTNTKQGRVGTKDSPKNCTWTGEGGKRDYWENL